MKMVRNRLVPLSIPAALALGLVVLASCTKRTGAGLDQVESRPVILSTGGQPTELDRVFLLHPVLAEVIAAVLPDLSAPGGLESSLADCPAGNLYCEFVLVTLAKAGTVTPSVATVDPDKVKTFVDFLSQTADDLTYQATRSPHITFITEKDAQMAIDGAVPWSTVPDADSPIHVQLNRISADTKITQIALGFFHEYGHKSRYPKAVGPYVTDVAAIGMFIGRTALDLMANYYIYQALRKGTFAKRFSATDFTETYSTLPTVSGVIQAADTDFGSAVHIGSCAVQTIKLTNTGGAPATEIAGIPNLPVYWAFAGGVYPGTAGTCASSLDAGASCNVAMAFCPAQGTTQKLTLPIVTYKSGAGGVSATVANVTAASVVPVYQISSLPSGYSFTTNPAITPPAIPGTTSVNGIAWWAWTETGTCSVPILQCANASASYYLSAYDTVCDGGTPISNVAIACAASKGAGTFQLQRYYMFTSPYLFYLAADAGVASGWSFERTLPYWVAY